jgi:hypothetical protein
MSLLLQRHGRSPIRPEDTVVSDWSFVNEESMLFFYWLGWMLADGCIRFIKRDGRNRGIITYLTVHNNDTNILTFFRDHIQASAIVHPKKDNCVRLDLRVPRLIAIELQNWGLCERKSHEFKMIPKLSMITNNQFLQLLCGLIEGDGSVNTKLIKSKKHLYPVPTIGLVNHISLITWVADRLTHLGYAARKICSQKGCYSYRIAGLDAHKLHAELMVCPYHLLNRKWSRIS